MNVIKRSGISEPLNVDKINKRAERICNDLDCVCASELVVDTQYQFHDGITTKDIDETLMLTARSKMYKDPEWGTVAARLLMSVIFKELNIKNQKSYFLTKYLNNSRIQLANIHSKETLEKASELLTNKYNNQICFVGLKNIYDRYLLRTNAGDIIETPEIMYLRIVLALNVDGNMERIKQHFDVIASQLATHSTPTMFNAGTTFSQLSSCYLTQIDDSIDGIFDGLWQNARKSKYAGGLGFHMSKIRATGSHIEGTNGKSTGLIPWLKIYNSMLVACNQGGKRPGAGCAYIEPWHKDIEEFIEIRSATGDERRNCPDLNTALWCPDLFFKRIEEDGQWTLFCPKEAEALTETYGEYFEQIYTKLEQDESINKVTIRAKDLWKKILKALFETSHPWITFKDAANKVYPNKYYSVLRGSNLCTEIFLHTLASQYNKGKKVKIGETAVCNLGSIVVSKFKRDFLGLEKAVRTMVRAMDEVIDENFYPTDEAHNFNKKFRPIGLGTMGWANLYADYDLASDGDVENITEEYMARIYYYAVSESVELAKEKGAFPAIEYSVWCRDVPNLFEGFYEFQDGVWEDLRQQIDTWGIRNSCLMAIAPNASTAYQVGVEQSVEPFYSMLFRYENKSGSYYIINEQFVADMKKEGIWNKQFAELVKDADGDVTLLMIPEKYHMKYKPAFKRNMFQLIKVNAVRQKYVDQGISFNMYNDGSSMKYLNDIYFAAWKAGLKSTYYLRNKPASTIQKVCSTKEECLSCQG